MDQRTYRTHAHHNPTIGESLSVIFEPFRRKRLEEDARKAGYDNVDEYRSDLIMKNPSYPARNYLECVNEHGVKSESCKRYKDSWLDCKAWQNGNKVTWNEEEVDRMLKQDAIKAGYKEGYFLNKDPKHLKRTARFYEKCVAEHGGEDSLCQLQKKNWLLCKAAQDEPFRERLMEHTRKAGYDDLHRYLSDLVRKNPIYPACGYLKCVDEFGAEYSICKSRKKRWLDYKAFQNGNKVTWNEEEVDKMLLEDAIKGGYKEENLSEKDPEHVATAASIYEKCVAERGAENLLCKRYEKYWLECKAAQNVALGANK